jgi:hypothetical protein
MLSPPFSADSAATAFNRKKASSRKETKKTAATTANASPTPDAPAGAAAVMPFSGGIRRFVPLK